MRLHCLAAHCGVCPVALKWGRRGPSALCPSSRDCFLSPPHSLSGVYQEGGTGPGAESLGTGDPGLLLPTAASLLLWAHSGSSPGGSAGRA